MQQSIYPLDLPRRSNKSKEKTIIYHGQISIERGLIDLVNAVPYLVKKGHSFKLKIYGTERIHGTIDKLNDLIQEFQITNFVNVHEQVPHGEMLKILSKAHIEVIPFHDHPMFRIGIPVKLFEAMWAKCAIVASELDPIKRYDDEFIAFFPPGDVESLGMKLDHLLTNDKDRIKAGEIGARLIKDKYNWGKVEDILLDVYGSFNS